MTRLQTGVLDLDRSLNGGIPAGSLVVVRSDPATQGEVVLKNLAQQRGTLFFSTLRQSHSVREWLDTRELEVEYTGMETPLESVTKQMSLVDDEANIIIDPVNILEEEEYMAYVSMLQQLKDHLVNTGSIGVLHVLEDENEGSMVRTTTMEMADMVWDVTSERKGNEISTHLNVMKCRSGVLPDKVAKVELSDEVSVDTSRDIA